MNKFATCRTISFKLALIVSVTLSLILCTAELYNYYKVKSDILERENEKQLAEARHIASDIQVTTKKRILLLEEMADSSSVPK